MNELEKLFAEKRTENGDKSYSTSGLTKQKERPPKKTGGLDYFL